MRRRHGFTKALRFEILTRDGFTCRYCGRSAPNVELRVDHIVPWSATQDNSRRNLVTACHDCNAGKGAKKLLTPKMLGVPDQQPEYARTPWSSKDRQKITELVEELREEWLGRSWFHPPSNEIAYALTWFSVPMILEAMDVITPEFQLVWGKTTFDDDVARFRERFIQVCFELLWRELDKNRGVTA